MIPSERVLFNVIQYIYIFICICMRERGFSNDSVMIDKTGWAELAILHQIMHRKLQGKEHQLPVAVSQTRGP